MLQLPGDEVLQGLGHGGHGAGVVGAGQQHLAHRQDVDTSVDTGGRPPLQLSTVISTMVIMMRPTFMLAACLPRLVSALSMTSSCSRELVWNISLTTATCLCCWVTRAGDTCTTARSAEV